MDHFERHMIDIASEIGAIADSNCHYTYGLSQRVQAVGIPIEQMTVGQLLTITNEYSARFNAR